ncbi:hypothetical protein V1522DRAFT_437192 [Lipomyces starkeyi]
MAPATSRHITEKYQVPVTVFGDSGYTDCSDPTVSAIPSLSNTQMKELRDYISWHTRDHLTHTDPKLSVLTSSIRPDSSYIFDASTVSLALWQVLHSRSDSCYSKVNVATSSLQLSHNVSSNGIMTLLTDASLTPAANPRVDLTVQLDADVPSAFHEGATVKLYYGAGNTAFALVDKVVSIERLLILKLNPRGVGFLSGKCFAFSCN